MRNQNRTITTVVRTTTSLSDDGTCGPTAKYESCQYEADVLWADQPGQYHVTRERLTQAVNEYRGAVTYGLAYGCTTPKHGGSGASRAESISHKIVEVTVRDGCLRVRIETLNSDEGCRLRSLLEAMQHNDRTPDGVELTALLGILDEASPSPVVIIGFDFVPRL